jgi:hypothetical protein
MPTDTSPRFAFQLPARLAVPISVVAGVLLLVGTTPATAPAPAQAQTRASAGHRVVVNEDGVLVIDGRKVFPIAFTMPPPAGGRTPGGREALGELHDAGANFLRTGVIGGAWDDAALEREQQYLDAAARNGMYCLVGLREASAIGDKTDRDGRHEALLRRIVSRFKDHPGLGGWKGADEPEWGKVPVDSVVHAYRVIKEVDPNHPVWIVQAPRGTVESLRAYDPAYDITGCDIYPIGYPPGTHSLRPNKEISMVGDFARTMREVTAGAGGGSGSGSGSGRKPFWMTLQIAWSGVIKPGKTLRFPTLPQERFMTYQSIVNGARGVVYFGGHLEQACTPEDAKLGWNWTFWNRALRPVVEEIGERSPLYPALVAPDAKLPVKVEGADGIEFCVREAGDGDVFLIACKREGATVEARFTGLPRELTDGEVLFESPRRVTAKDGTFTDWFAPFDVHVYRFRGGRPARQVK